MRAPAPPPAPYKNGDAPYVKITPKPPGRGWREYKRTSPNGRWRYPYDRWRDGKHKRSRYRRDLPPLAAGADYVAWKRERAAIRARARRVRHQRRLVPDRPATR